MDTSPYLFYKPDTVVTLQGDEYGICLPTATLNRAFEITYGEMAGVVFGDGAPSETERSAFWDGYSYSLACTNIHGNVLCGKGNIWSKKYDEDNLLTIIKVPKNRLTLNPTPTSVFSTNLLDHWTIPWRPMLVPLTEDGKFDEQPGKDNPTGEVVVGGSIMVGGNVTKPGYLYEANCNIHDRPEFVETEKGKELEWIWIDGVLISTRILARIPPKLLFDWGYAICTAYPYFVR